MQIEIGKTYKGLVNGVVFEVCGTVEDKYNPNSFFYTIKIISELSPLEFRNKKLDFTVNKSLLEHALIEEFTDVESRTGI